MKNQRHFFLLCLFACLTLTTTTVRAQTQLACHGTAQPGRVAELLFGRDVRDKLAVSDRDWAAFVARELTPRFPSGLTASDALGQWRDPASRKIVREKTKHVEIVLPGNADDDGRLAAVIEAYKHRFHQQSVGLIVRDACVSF